ncbi:uncharacterized protein LOC114352999 isoform X1 [Ostrinia furnacalis]|uniref:uncharacterized protein LOC114352999 isoform X1 n=1 Tax=Ostrinia furnacalis TaxID=93504 RepID=UPI00103D4933|nr:uncharacterized protein LOC114352999 isoform X1 [Ostrinia furnacalis]
MDKIKSRFRSENWTREEKDLLLELMRDSSHIVDNKQTDTDTNRRKHLEWLKIQNSLAEMTGKIRDVPQLKGRWRRMKMDAKNNILQNEKSERLTNEGNSSQSSSEDDFLCTSRMDHVENEQNIEENQGNDHLTKIHDFKRRKTETSHRSMVLAGNIDLKNYTKTLMKEEHELKMEYHKLELSHQQARHKLEIDVLLLEKEKKELEVKLLKDRLKD